MVKPQPSIYIPLMSMLMNYYESPCFDMVTATPSAHSIC